MSMPLHFNETNKSKECKHRLVYYFSEKLIENKERNKDTIKYTGACLNCGLIDDYPVMSWRYFIMPTSIEGTIEEFEEVYKNYNNIRDIEENSIYKHLADKLNKEQKRKLKEKARILEEENNISRRR